MQRLCYCVADCPIQLEIAEDAIDTSLLVSYEPFRCLGFVDTCLFSASIWTLESDIFQLPEYLGTFDCGSILVQVYKGKDEYVFKIMDYHHFHCCSMRATTNFKYIQIGLKGNDSQRFLGLNNALMIAFAFSATSKSALLVHASTIVCEGKGLLFLGRSGTGKSTHARLWKEAFPQIELLNDDNPVLRIVDDRLVVYGTPWSGKTPCYKNKSVPCGAIVRLSQACCNRIVKDRIATAYPSLLAACSTMIWDKASYNEICKTVEEVIKQVPLYHLECLPNLDAACMCHSMVM